MTNRRKFLIQCSAVATIASVPAGVGLCAPLRYRDVTLDRIGFSTFSRLIGTHFLVYQSLTPVKLELIEATAGQNHASHQLPRGREPEEFSLIFQGATHQPLEQDSYPFAHEKIGGFVMFIVPVGGLVAANGARYYEAVFNRPAAFAKPRR